VSSDAFYLSVKEDVDAIIEEFGTQYTVRARGGEIDPATLKRTAGATRTVTGLVDAQDFTATLGLATNDADNFARVSQKSMLFTAASALKENEEILVDSAWLSLNKLKVLKPANVILLYMLDLIR